MWYLSTMEFYSPTKKNEILLFADKWMGLENINLIADRKAQKPKEHMFSLIYGTKTTYKYKKYEKQVMLRGYHI
jgi:hypothetical protein